MKTRCSVKLNKTRTTRLHKLTAMSHKKTKAGRPKYKGIGKKIAKLTRQIATCSKR